MLVLKKVRRAVIFLFLLICVQSPMYGEEGTEQHPTGQNMTEESGVVENGFVEKSHHRPSKRKKLTYYLYVQDFVNSFIEIPTSNVSVDSSTISSKYLAGTAPVYNSHNEKVGICSASFLCMQNANGIFTDISNYLSIDNGLIVSWFTPTTLINLELDSIVHSMVTECIVTATTKIGFNPYYGDKFNMVVSSDSGKIYFKLYRK